MSSALSGLARDGKTNDPYLVAILRAQEINRFMGGAVVAPWNLVEMPGDWNDALLGLIEELPDLRETWKKVEAVKAELRKRK